MSNTTKNFNILTTNDYNYFNVLSKLFSNLDVAKFLKT